jgi:hypothetical protein
MFHAQLFKETAMPHFNDPLHLGPVRKRGPLANDPTRMDTGVGPLGQIYVYDIVPDAPDADGVIASQAITAAGGPATGINGALASGGVATFDVPRGVVAAWTGTATMTVTGTDMYGRAQSETSGSGTSFAGKKAFKTITAVAVSADVTGATVGTGDVLGLPFRVTDGGYLVRVGWDGAMADNAGTFVAADATSPATATTGDTRGTFDPSSAANGTRRLVIAMALTGIQAGPDATDIGVYGVAPF